MLETLKYIFSSPWIFIGTIVLIYVCGEALSDVVKQIKN